MIINGGGSVSILGSVGSLYMSILIILLVIGFGLVGLKLTSYVLNFEKNNKFIKTKKIDSKNNENIYKCLRIALYSFLAILVSMIMLTIIDPQGSMENSKGNDMNTSSSSQSTQNSSQHKH